MAARMPMTSPCPQKTLTTDRRYVQWLAGLSPTSDGDSPARARNNFTLNQDERVTFDIIRDTQSAADFRRWSEYRQVQGRRAAAENELQLVSADINLAG
jgi:hypothetical protein